MTTYLSTSYTITNPEAGWQPISATFATQAHPIGTIVEARDPNYGVGTFVYGPGVASTAVGSVVNIVTQDATNGSTALSNATHGTIGVAMSANVASQFGWYQIRGYNPNVLATGTAAANQVAYVVTGTPGTISSTSASNTVSTGMTIITAVSGGVAGCQLSFPTI